MMKINLLGDAAPAAKTISLSSSSPAARQALIFVGTLAVAMGITAFLYYYWGNQVQQEQTALNREQVRQKELAAVQSQNQLYQRQLKQLQERIDIIQKLQSSRQGPVDLMVGLGDMVNQTKELYLDQVIPAGNMLNIRGQAQSVEAIAGFIKALKDSPKFSSVQLKEYYQDDQQDRTTFKFNLECVYTPPEASGAASSKAATPAVASGAGR